MSDFERVLQWIDEMYVKIENENDSQEVLHLKQEIHGVKINLDHFIKRNLENGTEHWFCSDCGKIEFATYTQSVSDWMRKNLLCFGCNLWEERSKEFNQNPRKSFIADGVLWTDAGKRTNEKSAYLGCAGRVFKIRMLDGSKEWETNNLWCGGDIPKKYRETTMKDTAEFIKEDVPEVPF